MNAQLFTEEPMSGADHGHDAHAAPIHAAGSDSHGDGHGHGGEALGPIDVRAWGAAVLGIASALAVVGVLWVSVNPA